MQLDGCTYENGYLMFKTNDRNVYAFVCAFQPGDYEIAKKKQKRSLNANAYCWSLCQQIANAVHTTKEDVYRNAIMDVGSFVTMEILNAELENVARAWQCNGLGWQMEVVNQGIDYSTVLAYYGSSAYEVSEMSRLLEHLIEDAKALGIETLGPRERSLLLEDYEKHIS